MIKNFSTIYPISEDDLNFLVKHISLPCSIIGYDIGTHETPEGYEDYVTLDVIGEDFVWVNENFPKEKYTWYLWFESVFLIPKDMAEILRNKLNTPISN